MAWHGRKPKTTKGAAALVPALNVRLTLAQHAAYLAAGGAEWLRAQLEAEIVRQRLAPTPTANNPFPAFTVTDVNGQPIPHTTTTREY